MIRIHPGVFLAGLAAGIILSTGCELFTLEEITWTIDPPEGGILREGESPRISFSHPLDRNAAERALSLYDSSGSLSGRAAWEGAALIFSPDEDPVPGRLYTLTLEGLLLSPQGPRTEAHLRRSFYWETRSPVPRLTGVDPAPGEAIRPDQPLRFTFSQPLESRQEVSDEEYWQMSPEPPEGCRWEWLDGGRAALLIPRRGEANPRGWWPAGFTARWELSEALVNRWGAPLSGCPSGTFHGPADGESPRLTDIRLFRQGEEDADLGELCPDGVIRLTFSEAVELSPLPGAVHFQPPLRVDIRPAGAREVDLLLEEDPADGQIYSFDLTSRVTDLQGFPLDRAASEVELPLEIASRAALRAETTQWTTSGGSRHFEREAWGRIHTDSPLESGETVTDLYVTVTFNRLVEEGERSAVEDALALTAWAPGDLNDPSLFYWNWMDGKCLQLAYGDLPPSVPEEAFPRYYRLSFQEEQWMIICLD